MTQNRDESIRSAVREQYGRVAEDGGAGCGGTPGRCCETASPDAKSTSMALGYSRSDVELVPEGANMGLGCGNPGAIASLQSGETVLDLGSGGGFDAFLAVREVGPSGRVIGVDMTPEMVSRARENADKGGYANVDFRLGEIESLPVSDSSVDVIISNCVINLSPEKARVFREAYRVLKPGGRLAISDLVTMVEMPQSMKQDRALHAGCVSGASSMDEIHTMLREAGFEAITISPRGETREIISHWYPHSHSEDYVVSATIEAIKPMA